jgi:hypothetical protein
MQNDKTKRIILRFYFLGLFQKQTVLAEFLFECQF